MTAYVSQVRSQLGPRNEWEIVVEREWTPTRPAASDLPDDVREALRKWLDESA